MPTKGSNLLLELPRRERGGRRLQVEGALRDAIRTRRLPAGASVPPSRQLASDLGVSRRLVVEAYGQLVSEGYLVARAGAGTFVAAGAAPAPAVPAEPEPPRVTYDFFPGSPSLASFPRAAWHRAAREALAAAPDRALGYTDPRGSAEARRELSAYLARARGVVVDPDALVLTAGASHAVALLGRALARTGDHRVAVEDPSLDVLRAVLAAGGTELVPVAVDRDGLDVGALRASGARAVLATPAHQFPTGVALSPARRADLLDWAHAGNLVIEDDYNAEFRYDRRAVGALQGLAPERVAYVGSASKVLAPGLRLGWLAAPAPLRGALLEAKLLGGLGPSSLDELALARLLARGDFDRHLRVVRRLYRRRRDALLTAVDHHLAAATVTGGSAGLHAVVRLAAPVGASALAHACLARDVAVYPLSWFAVARRSETDAVVLGYGNLSEPALDEGVRRFADALASL